MTNQLSIYINENKVFVYDKNTRLPGKQRKFLDGMDLDMDTGIKLNNEMIGSPNKMQRANYVVMSLLYGIETKSEELVAATCSYLANRLPELKQINAIEKGDEVTLNLIFNEAT